jgi:hypothetical protein
MHVGYSSMVCTSAGPNHVTVLVQKRGCVCAWTCLLTHMWAKGGAKLTPSYVLTRAVQHVHVSAAGALQAARDQADKEAAARARHEDVSINGREPLCPLDSMHMVLLLQASVLVHVRHIIC